MLAYTRREDAQPTAAEMAAFLSSVEPADAEHIDGMIPEDGDSDTVDDRVMIIDISTHVAITDHARRLTHQWGHLGSQTLRHRPPCIL